MVSTNARAARVRVRVLVLFVLSVLSVFTKSAVLYTYYFIPGTHFYLDKNK